MSITSNLKKTGLRCAAASALAFPLATTSAGALVELGDNAALYFNGSATVRHTDNLFLHPTNEQSDWIFLLSPGVELNVGMGPQANVNLYYREDFYRYDDNSDLNSNQSNIFLESFYDMPRLNLTLRGSYEELIQPGPEVFSGRDRTAEGLIERDVYRGDLRGEYEISELFSASAGLNPRRVRFKDDVYSDSDSIAVPLNIYYSMTPKWDLSAGYRFRYTDTGDRRHAVTEARVDRPHYRDHYFNVGLRGELLPKLMGEVRGGYQERTFIGRDTTRDRFTLGSDLSYYFTPKLTLLAGASRDFETGALGNSIGATGGNVGARYNINHLFSVNGGLSYFERRYDQRFAGDRRTDDTFDANLGATYRPNVYVSLSAGYIFRTNDSTIDDFDFDNNIFSLSASLRF